MMVNPDVKKETPVHTDSSMSSKLFAGSNSASYSKKETDKKFKDAYEKVKDMNDQLKLVVIILLVMVATLVIDSFHINSATYREYSEKLENLDLMRRTNQELLNQNRQNQELLMELLKNKKE